jgi:signal peptidase II
MPKTKVYHWVRVALILIAAGAVGNFIDRLLNGYVIDFLYFALIDFPVFNVADIFVVCGSFLLGIVVIFFVKDPKE